MPNSARKSCTVQTSIVVALARDKPGQDENSVAIKLRDNDDLNLVRVIFKHSFHFIKCFTFISHLF